MVKGIYKITNNRTGEVYVGQSFNVFARRGKHFKELTLGTHHNKGLQEDHDRGDTFTFEVLEKMPEATREDLEEREIYYINKFNSFYEGYNQTPGGEYDKYKGRYEYGGGRLPFSKYAPIQLFTQCPDCGGELVKRNGKYGEYAGCINYPKCDFSCSLKKVISTSLKSICKSCGKIAPEESYYFACPFCGTPLDEDLDKDTVLTLLKKQSGTTTSDSGMSFKQFSSKKRKYLNKYDCDFLSEEYHIDIDNVDTVKESNVIIKNYLTENDLWNSAMEDLFINNIRLSDVKYKQKIGDIILGSCPDCGNNLKRESEFFITCVSYPDCDFSCIDDYYYDHILKLNSEREIAIPETNDEITPNPIRDYNYNENETNNQEKLQNDGKLNKSVSNNDAVSINSINKENLNYCSKCGSEIDLNDTYCGNCGEKIVTESKPHEIDTTPAPIKKIGIFESIKNLISNLIVPLVFFSAIGGPFLNGLTNYVLNPIFFTLAVIATIACFILVIYGCIYERDNAGGIIACLILGLWNLFLAFIFSWWLLN